MKRIEKYDLIEQYLLGKASVSEVAEVELRIKNDAEFANEVELHRNMQHLIFDSSLLEVKDVLQKIRTSKQLKLKRRTRLYRGLFIVGFCASILTISLLLSRKKDIAVRPASEAFKASEAFLDTVEPRVMHREMVQKKKEIPGIKREGNKKEKSTVTNQTVTESGKTDVEKTTIGEKPRVHNNQPVQLDQTPPKIPLLFKNKTSNLSDSVAKPCHLNAQYLAFPSCNSGATGIIQIIEKSVTGGIPPIKSALNGVFSDSLIYRNLKPGLYQLEVMDAAGCVKKFDFVQIDEKQCFEKDTKFSPDFEIWNIPIEPGHPGVLKIFNRSGQIVYQLKFDGSPVETWNGKNQNGEALPYGLYPFTIKYDAGGIFTGTVTIVGEG